MNRWLCAPILVSLTACNLSQELEGPPGSDAGPDAASSEGGGHHPATDAGAGDHAVPPPGSDAGSPDGSPPLGPVSLCTPDPVTGTSSVLINGRQSYIEDVTDIAFGPGEVYAFSIPFGFYGTPLSGGAVRDLSPTATLPSLIAAAVAPGTPALSGVVTAMNVLSVSLPSGAGTLLGLRGPASYEVGVTPGEIAVDGTDVFYWTPSSLVQTSLAGAGERVLADYSASSTTITAMGFDATTLYFASSDKILHATPRSGGAVTTLATLFAPIDGIIPSGKTLYLPAQRLGGTGRADFSMSSYDISSGSVTSSLDLPLLISRTSPVVFDGVDFYWGASEGETNCGGVLLRLPLSSIPLQSPPDTLVKHLDIPLVVALQKGSAYVGTSNDATYRTPIAPGQLLVWSP